MVGGYFYPFGNLVFGTNDLVKMFGSAEEAASRVHAATTTGKPMFITVVSEMSGSAEGVKEVYPVNAATPSDNGFTINAGPYGIAVVIDIPNNTATATVTAD